MFDRFSQTLLCTLKGRFLILDWNNKPYCTRDWEFSFFLSHSMCWFFKRSLIRVVVGAGRRISRRWVRVYVVARECRKSRGSRLRIVGVRRGRGWRGRVRERARARGWSGTTCGTAPWYLRRWYGGQQLAPDGQKLAEPAATEGSPLFLSSLVVLLRSLARSLAPYWEHSFISACLLARLLSAKDDRDWIWPYESGSFIARFQIDDIRRRFRVLLYLHCGCSKQRMRVELICSNNASNCEHNRAIRLSNLTNKIKSLIFLTIKI